MACRRFVGHMSLSYQGTADVTRVIPISWNLRSWGGNMWVWFIANMQIVSSLVFSVASACLAILALWVAYRNNFGWAPIVLVLRKSASMEGDDRSIGAVFEVWNRRKYPIVVRQLDVHFNSVRVVESVQVEGSTDKLTWQVSRDGGMFSLPDVVLGPSAHERFEVEGRYVDTALDISDELPEVRVKASYFDPKKNKHRTEVGDSHVTRRRSAK